jgi:hypothetical protein
MKSKAGIALLLAILWVDASAQAQSRFFVGGAGGISTLSADAQTAITATSVAVSLYSPSNGPALNVFGGTRLSDFLSLQGNYIWNRNELDVLSSLASSNSVSLSEEKLVSSQSSAILDLLLYFRNQGSWARPYLSAGSGVVHFTSRRSQVLNLRDSPALPPVEFTSNKAALRVAVGIDMPSGGGSRSVIVSVRHFVETP